MKQLSWQCNVRLWPMLTLNMVIESPYATSYLMVVLMFAISVTGLEIFAIEMCMTLILTFRMDQGQIQICQSMLHNYATSYFMAIVILAFTVCEILTVEMCTALIFRMDQCQLLTCKMERPCATLFVGNINVCSICHRLRDNHVWTC